MRIAFVVGGALVLAGAVALQIPIQNEARAGGPAPASRHLDAPKPARPLSLLFLHHSVGAQLLADPGSDEGKRQHENGGGLRRLLEAAGYGVHSATYGSRLGERTDLFDWPDKFAGHMDEILTTNDGASALPSGARHDVVLFKSCFPNNAFVGAGTPPGNEKGPELTVENAKAALRSLLPEFRKHPDVLFVFLTTPPLAPKSSPVPLWKWAIKTALGRGPRRLEEQAKLAGDFNDWVVSEKGWLGGYPLKNVAVIDYQGMLANEGHLLAYPSGDGSDSHPSRGGQERAAPRVLAALNHAVQRSEIDKHGSARVVSSTRE